MQQSRPAPSSSHISALIGSVLLCAGVVWILNGLHIVSLPFYTLVNSFYSLWPLILIVLGLCLLFRSKIIAVALGILYSAVIVLNAYGVFGIVGPNYFWHQSINDDAAAYEQVATYQSDSVALSPDITAAAISLSVGTPKKIVFEGQNGADLFNIETDAKRYTVNNYTDSADAKKMMLDVNLNSMKIDQVLLKLNESVDWALQIQSGTGDMKLNLGTLRITKLDIECGAGKIDATLSSLSPARVPVSISAGAGDIQFRLPKDSGYSITSSSAATSITADGQKISGIGEKSYQSKNFENARQVFYFNISSGASNITIVQE